jgi:hypothetical protein
VTHLVDDDDMTPGCNISVLVCHHCDALFDHPGLS